MNKIKNNRITNILEFDISIQIILNIYVISQASWSTKSCSVIPWMYSFDFVPRLRTFDLDNPPTLWNACCMKREIARRDGCTRKKMKKKTKDLR